MGCLEPHGQGSEAALGGSVKCLTALEEVLVEVEADICLQALWETLQDLKCETRVKADTIVVRWDVERSIFKSCHCFDVQRFIMC